ncbi:MAG: response regulator transcription factor [Deltaproteobacteria bacterium]|nr:response regulator transcription factor [Deltaproteobacteria bacterium]
MPEIRVLVADDHSIVREGLRQLLSSQPDMEIVGEAKDGQEALQMARSLRPDVTLIDIAMPRLNGIEAVRLIKEAMPESQIVVLSMHKKEAFVHEVLASGALGYVLKASNSSDVLEAIRAANRGEYFLCSQIEADVISTYLKSGKQKPAVRGYDLLSEREQQVFRLVVEGHSTGQIADLLFLSPKTVEKHRSNIMRKLGVNDVLGMVKYAVKIGLVDPDLWED